MDFVQWLSKVLGMSIGTYYGVLSSQDQKEIYEDYKIWIRENE